MATDKFAARRSALKGSDRSANQGKLAPRNNSAGRPTLVELERRKVEIMKVATAMFVREGYSGTSLVDIAKTSGVATRTLYQHYGGKEALFESVMFARETAAVFGSPQVREDDTLFEAMMVLAQYICEVTFRSTTVEMMRLAIAESQRFPEMMKKLMVRSQASFNTMISKSLDDLVSKRLIQDADTSAAAELFINLVLGNAPLWVFGGWKAAQPTKKQLGERVELFILGRWGAVVAKRSRDLRGKRAPEMAAPSGPPIKRPRKPAQTPIRTPAKTQEV